MPFDPFAFLNAVGLVAFAFVGALKATDAGLDVFGVTVLGVVTALGGGTLRDVLVADVPASLQSVGDVTVALSGVALAVAVVQTTDVRLRDSPVVLVPDALGLAAFAATGALVGTDAGVSPFGVVALATLTAVGGGSISDILLSRVPVVLRDDFYATPAVLGGVAFWSVSLAGASVELATGLCAALVFVVRILALRYRWRLPTPAPRENRAGES
jgi:uncharacterized membrane protein YeiH